MNLAVSIYAGAWQHAIVCASNDQFLTILGQIDFGVRVA